MNKSESKYFNTAKKMDEAFLTLLAEKDFEYITVKEICSLAGVNRSTFYLHYETVGDLLLETVEYINGKFSQYFEGSVAKDIENTPLHELNFINEKYLFPWLTFIQDNKKLFLTCINKYAVLQMDKNYDNLLKKIIYPIFDRYDTRLEDREYIILFYFEGIIAIVKQWIRGKCSTPIEEISKIIMTCVHRNENKGNG